MSLGDIVTISNFISNTALTWFDVGVYTSEWIDAAMDSDYERMIEINYIIAGKGIDYSVDAVLFTIDLLFTQGILSMIKYELDNKN